MGAIAGTDAEIARCARESGGTQNGTEACDPRNDEPGCILYVFAADPVEPDRISVHELWSSAEELEAHFLHTNYHDMRVLLGSHGITGAVVSKYRTDAEALVYNTSGIATASFE